MKANFIPGLGTVITQDPEVKSEVVGDHRSLAEKASLLPDSEQNQTVQSGMSRQIARMDQKSLAATAAAINKAIEEKHELLTDHSHDELTDTDANEVKDTEMCEGIDELTDPGAETGEEEPKIPTKKLKPGDKVKVPGKKNKSVVFVSEIDPIVAKSMAFGTGYETADDLVVILEDSRLEVYPLSELMPE